MSIRTCSERDRTRERGSTTSTRSRQALAERVPENALLSHDLFEGLFARAGLVTDVDLFEEFPTNYEVAVRRHHRWVRGDWQLLPWILGDKGSEPGTQQRTHIPVHGRWKMVDNLRRSLSAPSSFLLAVAAWTLPAVSPLLWTSLFLAAIALPAFMPVLDGLIPRRQGFSKRSHRACHGPRHPGGVAAGAAGHHHAGAPGPEHDGCGGAHARAALRDQATSPRVGPRRAGRVWRRPEAPRFLLAPSLERRPCPAAGVLFVVFKPGAWPVAGPLVLLWALAPILAWRLSSSDEARRETTPFAEDTRTLRLLARRTWRFFETFVNEEEHALPPDNFQEDPEPVVAHRTSPTNMGLYLLSTMVAHDFGWIGISDMVQRLEATLETMTAMRRFHGHFVNWYDTRDLRPLDPLYISTVDSGNLAGHLIALTQGCRELARRPPSAHEVLDGIRDALQPVLDSVAESQLRPRTETVTALQVREALDAMSAVLEDPPSSISEWGPRFEEMEARADNLLDIVRTLSAAAGTRPSRRF